MSPFEVLYEPDSSLKSYTLATPISAPAGSVCAAPTAPPTEPTLSNKEVLSRLTSLEQPRLPCPP